jgi:hypothetical protein
VIGQAIPIAVVIILDVEGSTESRQMEMPPDATADIHCVVPGTVTAEFTTDAIIRRPISLVAIIGQDRDLSHWGGDR